MKLRSEHFIALNLSRYLNDGLVGQAESVNANNRARRLPLTTGTWAFVFADGNVYTSEGTWFHHTEWVVDRPSLTNHSPVLTFYSREAGAGCRHAWQESTTSIGAISYLVVRAFEVVGPSRNLFRLIHSTQARARAETFMHLPSTHFLCRIQQRPAVDGPGNVILSEDDWSVFQKLAGDGNRRRAVATAITKLNTANRKRGGW